METIQLHVLTEGVNALPRVNAPSVHVFPYPIPEHTLEEWKSIVTVNSYISISISTAMVCTLLKSMSTDDANGHTDPPMNPQVEGLVVLCLANDLKSILGESMDTATAMIPQKPSDLGRGTFPNHL